MATEKTCNTSCHQEESKPSPRKKSRAAKKSKVADLATAGPEGDTF
jgi:hypothetical protein